VPGSKLNARRRPIQRIFVNYCSIKLSIPHSGLEEDDRSQVWEPEETSILNSWNTQIDPRTARVAAMPHGTDPASIGPFFLSRTDEPIA
jgi:hypothetical protein